MKPILFFAAALVLAGCGNGHDGAIEASGTLEAVEVNVSSKVAGQLLELRVQEGSTVRTGDTLAVLDHKILQLQLDQAEAGVALAESQYTLLKNGARAEDLQTAEEAVRQAASAAQTAGTDFERIKELYRMHSVARKQYDDAESRYTITQAQWNAAKQNLLKLQRFARPEDLAAAKARVDQARAQAGLVRQQLSDSYIIAPVGGTITYKPVEVGELIGTGTVIVRISQLSSLELMIYVNETDLGKIRIGSPADVVIDTYPDRTYSGTVIYISPVAEFTPRNVQTKDERTKLVYGVKLQVQNGSGDLKAGMPADAYVK